MIARLRRRHRRLVSWVGVIAVTGLVAALTVRPSRLLDSPSWPPETDSWASFGPDGQIRIVRTTDRLSLTSGPRPGAPDLLVYWQPLPPVHSRLVLLGAVGDPGVRSFALPPGAADGLLIIHSLGHRNELVDFFPVKAVPKIE